MAIRRISLPFEGTATKLLEELSAAVDESTRKSKSWPSVGRVLSNSLRRLAPNLRAVGIDVKFERQLAFDCSGSHSNHASWLNQLEIYFSVVQRKVLTPNDFHSLAQLEAQPPGRHLVPTKLKNTPLWLYFRSVRSSEKLVKL